MGRGLQPSKSPLPPILPLSATRQSKPMLDSADACPTDPVEPRFNVQFSSRWFCRCTCRLFLWPFCPWAAGVDLLVHLHKLVVQVLSLAQLLPTTRHRTRGPDNPVLSRTTLVGVGVWGGGGGGGSDDGIAKHVSVVMNA